MANKYLGDIKSWVWGNKPTKITWTYTQHLNYGGNPAKYAGIDIRMTSWPLYSPDNGVVYQSFRDSGGAEIITLKHNTKSFTGFTQYAHLSSRLVEKGQKIKKGQIIGYSGKTGSVPYHLHFAVIRGDTYRNDRRFDPYNYLLSVSDPNPKPPVAPKPPVEAPKPPEPTPAPVEEEKPVEAIVEPRKEEVATIEVAPKVGDDTKMAEEQVGVVKKWYQSKTIWASLATVVTGLGLFFSGEQSLEELLLSLVGVVFGVLRFVTDSGVER